MKELKNTFVSVDEDLPCNHEELLDAHGFTYPVFVMLEGNMPAVAYMSAHIGSDGLEWCWSGVKSPVTHWMPVPKTKIK